jgi:hypothetical protein
MEKETIVHKLRFGIKITSGILTDNSKVYNVRIPIQTINGLKDIYIEADNEREACKIAELIDHGGSVDIKESL